MSVFGRVAARLLGTPRPLDLSEGERRTLMTWGMLGGIVSLTLILLWIVNRADAHFDPAGIDRVQVAIVAGLFGIAYAVIGLAALFAVGMVAIARGGSMEASISKDGVSVELAAEGSAASHAARNIGAMTEPAGRPPADGATR